LITKNKIFILLYFFFVLGKNSRHLAGGSSDADADDGNISESNARIRLEDPFIRRNFILHRERLQRERDAERSNVGTPPPAYINLGNPFEHYHGRSENEIRDTDNIEMENLHSAQN
jgi:hypothetical protein